MAEENIVIKIKADIGITKEVIETITKALEGMGKTATIVSGNVKVTNKNLEDTNKILGQVGQTAGKTSKTMGGVGDAVKKSNQQWTNFALILQDLPYGFRGIQNNLPAVIGGLAGMTGPIYLATSAIIAFFTAYDNGAFGSTKTNEDWKKSIKETNDELKNSVNYTTAEISNLQGLIAVMTDVNSTEGQRKKALQEVKEAITKVDEAEGKKITGLYSAITAVNLYTEAIQQQQMQEVIGKRIAEISLDQIQKRNNLALETRKAERGIHPIDAFMGNQELTNLQAGIIANETLLRQLEDLRVGNTKALLSNPFSKFNAKGQTSAQGASEAKKEADLKIKANEAETNAYLNSLDDRAKKEFQAGLDLEKGLETMRAAGFSNSETYYASYRANMDRIAKEYDDKEYKRNQESINANIAFETKIYKDSERAYEAIQKKKTDSQVKYTKDRVDSLNLELKTELKLHRNSITLMQEDINMKIKQLELLKVFAFGNVESIEIINKAINNQKAQLKGYGESWDSTSQQIKGIIEGVLTDVITQFATNIGQALAGEKVDIFGGIGEMIAEGAIAIGKALIAYGVALTAFKLAKLNPALAIVAGAGLVLAGSFLKSKLSSKDKTAGATPFASGGIVSGPTMGLIGEYPGAKSNPEVVAPLDKLKDMLGGNGGGSFVLRGSDLVLALNRSETSLNLRRGS
jgi:hypothetical protein